jgi:hypothetical protein
MQMWEYMGKLILDSDLLKRMAKLGFDDKAVFDAVNGAFDPVTKQGGYYMSRAEISDIAGLLGRREFVDNAPVLGGIVRDALRAADFPDADYAHDPKFAKLREAIGLLCIDSPMLLDLSKLQTGEEVRAEMARHNFSFPDSSYAEALRHVVGRGGLGIAIAHKIHAAWSPPECFAAVTFTPKFVRCHKGGVGRGRTVVHANHPPGPTQSA